MATSHGIVTQDAPTSNGTQDFTKTSLGTVKGYMLWATEDTPVNTDFSDTHISVGVSDLAAVNGFVAGGNEEDNQATTDSKKLINNDALVYCATAGQDTVTEGANHDSTITDGVRVDWTTTTTAVASSAILFKEGIDNFDAQMVTLAGTGATTVTCGFNPDIVICYSTGSTSQASSNSFRTGMQFYKQTSNDYAGIFVSTLNNDLNPSTAMHYTTAAVGGNTSPSTGSLDDEYTLSNFTATGFDATKIAQTNAQVCIFICLKLASGYSASVGTVSAPTSTGVTSIITGLDHTPQIALFAASGITTSDTGATSHRFSYGACDADAQVTIGGWAEDSGGATQNSNCGGHHHDDAVILIRAADGATTRSVAGFSAFQSDGVDLNFTDADDPVQIAYLTIGPDTGGGSTTLPGRNAIGRGIARGLGRGVG